MRIKIVADIYKGLSHTKVCWFILILVEEEFIHLSYNEYIQIRGWFDLRFKCYFKME